MRALLATTRAVERRASISRDLEELGFVARGGKALLPAPTEQRRAFDVPKQDFDARLFHRKGGGGRHRS